MNIYPEVRGIPVLLNGDHTKPIGRANVYIDGSVSLCFSGELGDAIRKELICFDIKSLSVGYEYLPAKPKVNPLDTNIHCVDGVDGLTPDMLRVYPEEPTIEGRLW